MRIVAGQFGGRKLISARGIKIRPAADRVKETIFNVLQNKLSLKDARVLDLFAGTGSLGIEALSRGAFHATFVDVSETSLQLLRSNISLLRCEDTSTVVKADAMKFIEKIDTPFDLIYGDPPYAYQRTAIIPKRIFERNLLKKKGVLIIEHTKTLEFSEASHYQLAVRKEFGQTVVSFFTHTL